MGGLDKKLPQVIKAVGDKNKPSTSNAAETFFSRFDLFYKAKRGYFRDNFSKKSYSIELIMHHCRFDRYRR